MNKIFFLIVPAIFFCVCINTISCCAKHEKEPITKPLNPRGFLEAIKEQITYKDAKGIAAYVNFPVRIDKNGKKAYIDEKTFLNEFDNIFNDHVSEVILSQNPDAIYENDIGWCVGRGEIIFGTVHNVFKILYINNDSYRYFPPEFSILPDFDCSGKVQDTENKLIKNGKINLINNSHVKKYFYFFDRLSKMDTIAFVGESINEKKVLVYLFNCKNGNLRKIQDLMIDWDDSIEKLTCVYNDESLFLCVGYAESSDAVCYEWVKEKYKIVSGNSP